MSRKSTLLITVLAMVAFAGNSLLCRLALKQCGTDPATFTSIRIITGALALWLITRTRCNRGFSAGSWRSAAALFAYAAGFSYAYVTLPAATGALLLFGAVQTSMIGYGLWSGERLAPMQWAGLVAAFCGLAVLLLPGLSAPPLIPSLLMSIAGIAWGVYSLRGKGAGDPTTVTAGNFLRAVPMAVVLSATAMHGQSIKAAGLLYATCSGALASGVGYALWYVALEDMDSTTAATVQLSVPVLAGIGGILFLDESVTVRLLIASTTILGGIALVILNRQPSQPRVTVQPVLTTLVEEEAGE